MSSGKNFEQDFKNSFTDRHEARILRLHDTTNGFAGVNNPCDFVYYAYPSIGFFELKSIKGDRLPFSNISENQWNGLLLRCKLRGAIGAILIQFQDHREGWLVPIDWLDYYRSLGNKSIHIDTARQVGMDLKLKYKRTRCGVDPDVFMFDFLQYKYKEV